MISVVCWRWPDATGKHLFGVEYVNRLRAALARNLHIPHQLWCIGSDTRGIDSAVRCIPGPQQFDPFRCRRRIWQFAKEREALFGKRILAIDLDVVIVDDITSLVDRPEPIVCWRVGYAGVYSGSFLLFDAGALHGLHEAYRTNPRALLARCGEVSASDQAMINTFLRGKSVAQWTERDGMVTWFGSGYESREHHGMSARNPDLPKGARVVVFGSADIGVMEEGRYPWIRECWA